MNDVIGEILPLALGIAISPIPIIAAILMLLSPRAKGTSVGFLLGWVVGIVVAVTVFTLLASVLPENDADASNPTAGWIKIGLGVLLLLMAVKQWRGRPTGDDEPALPKWMKAIDTMTAAKGAGLGFLLSAVNPKNLIMAAGAGVIIGGTEASLDDRRRGGVDRDLHRDRGGLGRRTRHRLPRRLGQDGRTAGVDAPVAGQGERSRDGRAPGPGAPTAPRVDDRGFPRKG